MYMVSTPGLPTSKLKTFFSLNITATFDNPFVPTTYGRRGDLKVNALDLRSSGPGLNPGWGTALSS